MPIYVSSQQPTLRDQFATESGHWYHYPTGESRYTVLGKNGKERPTTLRDAKKSGGELVPSVTTIIKTMASPGLDRWKQEQVLLAALTLSRKKDESDDSYILRIINDSKEQGKQAADRGSLLHGAIERWIVSGGKDAQGEWQPHVDATHKALLEIGVDLLKGDAERSFSHQYGFGGKIDWSSKDAVVDFKSKPSITDKVKGYDEHVMQLAAYDFGLEDKGRRLINVFIGCDDVGVKIVEWTKEEADRGWKMFLSCLDFWKAKTGYTPARI